MVFRKPYAFLIKHFRLINLILSILFCYLAYKLKLIQNVINNIYTGVLSNFSNLNSIYIGFVMFLLIVFIILLVVIIVLLLYRKKKPIKDYLFSLVYIGVVIIYLFIISNLFFRINEEIVEQTTLKVYSDVSFLIIIPIIYFIVKFFIIAIGFNLNKFNFSQDILELKQEEKDNEEVEVVFGKNSYKYKRRLRRASREFKYYVLENKLIIGILLAIVLVVLFVFIFNTNIFKSNKVKLNQYFLAAGLNYKILDIYETGYDLNYKQIKNNSKYVIVNMNIKNNNSMASSIDFKRLRLVYGNEYVYPNNYNNKYFYDLGVPYNNEPLKSGEEYNYIFIFEVPKNYKKNNYVLKFYNKISVEDNEIVGNYKEIKVNAKKIDIKRLEKKVLLKENTVFDDSYGKSNLTITNYQFAAKFVYKNNSKTISIRDEDINKVLLILDYKLLLDDNKTMSKYFKSDLDFFDKFVNLSYNINGSNKKYSDVRAIGNVKNKIMLSVPYEVQNSSNITLEFDFRNIRICYKLK